MDNMKQRHVLASQYFLQLANEKVKYFFVPELYQILGTWILLFWIIPEHVPPLNIFFNSAA
jgi:hypothetical protein